jgi:branched-chain amino acid transport system ATP-binding protein
MEALRVEGLSKNFSGVHALCDVSFSVEVGEKLVIIGSNGAGKTTLFNILNGQIGATTGYIYLFGKEVTNFPTHRRVHLGQSRSFQITSLLFNLTIHENCLLALHGKQASPFQVFRPITAYKHLFHEAQELLERIDLWGKRNELVKNMSYGEQRRLEIIISLASKPNLLLLDEPSAGLTASESIAIMEMIRNLGPDVAAIVIAHDMDLVFGVAERIIVLHHGRIISQGTPEEVQSNPKVKETYMGIESV